VAPVVQSLKLHVYNFPGAQGNIK